MTSSSPPSAIDRSALSGRLEREDAEVEAAIEHLGADLPRRARGARPRVTCGCVDAKSLDERQQRVDGGLVGADEHAPAPDLQLAHRRFRLRRQPQQPLGVVQQQAPGLGQRAVFDDRSKSRSPELVLEPPDRLADRRLRPVQLRAAREKLRSAATATKRNCQVLQLHPV